MLRPRIIPCLLIYKSGLVKTKKFTDHKYVGDPLNAVRIFNEKQVDELVVADIDATSLSREPDYDLIAKLASECRMPLCYVGGVKTAEQCERIISLGVEKIGISSAAVENDKLISEAAKRVGNQSIVVVIDVKKAGFLRRYEVFTHNGKKSTGLDPLDLVERAVSMGAGEIIINSIDHDGTMKGYCYDLIDQLIDSVKVPFSILGGAGSFSDLKDLIKRYGVIGAAAGSIFVFKGKYRAVLIQYPDAKTKLSITKL
jgi:cyclase